jgi:hypothetical protein
MIPSSASRLFWLCGALALAVIAVATVGPSQWVPRTGIHWLVDHFVVYFAVTSVICLACPRPFVVATSLIFVAGLLEGLQGLTLDRTPDLLSALSGALGVLTAALLAWIIMRVMPRHPTRISQT